MSSKSFDSFATTQAKRLSKRVTDEDVIQYALRVAYLAYLMQPKPADQNGLSTPSRDPRESKDYSSRIAGAVSNSFFSIGDLIKDAGRDGPRSVKFPEKLVQVLELKLQAVAMGKESSYSDQLTRRIIAIFYGQYSTDSFKKQMKQNRKIEELILMFASTATSVLRKDQVASQNPGEQWKAELNEQIGQFVRMLRECLRGMHGVTPELSSRLDMYTAKLAGSTADAGGGAGPSTPRPSVIARNGSTRRDDVAGEGINNNVKDMKMVKVLAALVGMSDADLQTEVNNLRRTCTEKAALLDLKTCLKNINANEPFPGQRDDFESESAWTYWRQQELATLSQLMLIMVQFNPGLAKSTPGEVLPSVSANGGRPGSLYAAEGSRTPGSSAYDSSGLGSRHGSVSSRHSLAFPPTSAAESLQDDEEVPVGHIFTYIPPNPRRYYKRLLELCVQADLLAMDSLPPDQEVSLGILSAPHVDLLSACAVRWRIGHSYRVSAFLDTVRYMFEREEVPLDCIPEALGMVEKMWTEVELDKWTKQDRDYLATIFGSLFDIFSASLYHALDPLPALKPSHVSLYIDILQRLRTHALLQRAGVDTSQHAASIVDRAEALSTLWYSEKKAEFLQTAGVNRALPLLFLTDEIEKAAKVLDKRFPEPMMGLPELDLTSIFLGSTVPLYLDDLDGNKKAIMEGSKNQPNPDVPVEDIFSLFRRTQTIVATFKDICPKAEVHMDTTVFFEPYVRQWLVTTDNKVVQWVQAAIAADKFEAESEAGTSSSIVDLFDSLRSPIQFLVDLNWPDEYRAARFFTSLSKTVSKGVELYCRDIEELFMEEMFPRPTETVQPKSQRDYLLQRARETIQLGEKRVEGFNFSASSCVKLNNIDASRKLLDNMYAQMESDKVAQTLKDLVPPIPEKAASEKFLFTVKVVLAEGLVPLDSSPSTKLDTFVTLSDEHGNRLAKTRTIYENADPRWEETFDLSVEKPLWLMASVRDRALIGKHDTVGRGYICLDPRRYGDFLAHDLFLDLDTTGRILLRISMEGEQDDIQFYFGRAFRSLKRCEGDMVRIFIDKMSPLIRQSLSRTVLRALVRSGPLAALDYNKAIGNVKDLYQKAIGGTANEVQIPLPHEEKPRIREGELTEDEIAAPIEPLFQYLDLNLQVINSSLSDAMKEMVMTRAWKEILSVIEGLLIPPLSAYESDMKPLSEKEVDIVFKWLKSLLNFFYVDGEGPVPLEALQNQKYRDVMSIRLYYDWSTDELMEECVRMMQQSLRAAPTLRKKAKSVYSQRNLGTIKDRKREKKEAKEITNGDTIMRILRMRPRTTEFLTQQLSIMHSIQNQNEQTAQVALQGRGSRKETPTRARIPQVPPLPPLPPLRSPGQT